jgi:hypothetical protein
MDAVYDYFREYDKATFEVFACQGNEPSEQDIVAFERAAGSRLPEEFRDFTMGPLGGLYLEVREELWPRAEGLAVGSFWTFRYGIKVFGISEEIPDWLDIRVRVREFREAGIEDLVPFLAVVGDADRYCFTPAGAIVRWYHDGDEPTECDETFGELLLREIHELEERKDRKLADEAR